MATAPGAAAQVTPGKGLGFLTLGASLHHTLHLLRQHPKTFPTISTIYPPSSPLTAPLIITLDSNGLRLRFDGPDQRLRLIEVTDFSKCRLTYNNGELSRGGGPGPTCRGIYNKLFGPTFPGEYIEGKGTEKEAEGGVYVLSYPGVAFTFPVEAGRWREGGDAVSLLANTPAQSMAVFVGDSWKEARDTLFTRPVTAPRMPGAGGEEVESVTLHDGHILLHRRHNTPFKLVLHSTTPQDLITALGPPSAIYRKTDKRLTIHRIRGHHDPEDLSDSADSDGDDSPLDTAAYDCFYNYFHHGLDIFLSTPHSSRHPVATKLIIHGNVPGSYEFQRYRRCRWVVDMPGLELNSEQSFEEMEGPLRGKFGEIGQPMPYFRGHEYSPSSSCELLGGWEDGRDEGREGEIGGGEGTGEEDGGVVTYGKVDLVGVPGLVFEVLKGRRAVSGVTVF